METGFYSFGITGYLDWVTQFTASTTTMRFRSLGPVFAMGIYSIILKTHVSVSYIHAEWEQESLDVFTGLPAPKIEKKQGQTGSEVYDR